MSKLFESVVLALASSGPTESVDATLLGKSSPSRRSSVRDDHRGQCGVTARLSPTPADSFTSRDGITQNRRLRSACAQPARDGGRSQAVEAVATSIVRSWRRRRLRPASRITTLALETLQVQGVRREYTTSRSTLNRAVSRRRVKRKRPVTLLGGRTADRLQGPIHSTTR